MARRGIVGKTLGFGTVAVACAVGGALVFYGPHAYNDYFNTGLALVLWLFALAAAGLGVLFIGADLADERARKREEKLHVTPRPGPLGPPPPWGMGDVGRVGGSVREVGGGRGPSSGGGSPRLMSVVVHNWDAPVVIGLLLLWTLVALTLWAPRLADLPH